MIARRLIVCVLLLSACSVAVAEKFTLLTGVDARRYPGTERMVAPLPGAGVPGSFFDGDRLAGTSDTSIDVVPFVGLGTPMFEPNEFGSLSMLYRRGSVPLGPAGQLPLMGIEFLGGPLLDLDGDLENDVRSLVPSEDAEALAIPGTDSFIELEFDFGGGVVSLVNFDATGNNEGGPSIPAGTATILVTLAGTGATGELGEAINPEIDTRAGTVTPFAGDSGLLVGVYRIESLGYEIWEDSIDATTATAGVLGTMQFLGSFRGWLIERDPASGVFPALAGEGLDTTRWPEVDTSAIGTAFSTANGLAGGSATIADGVPGDAFSAANNGGLALSDFGGDLGAYLDAIVAPLVPATSDRFVYLESAGFGINNSFDPVYADTVSYDAVIIAAEDRCLGLLAADANCDGALNAFDIDPFVVGLTTGQAGWEALPTSTCDYYCAIDVNGDGLVNAFDIDPFVQRLTAAR